MMFKKEWLKPSDYPSNFIPNGAQIFIGVDRASPNGDCTVKGFYENGEYHIQEVEQGLTDKVNDYGNRPQ